MPAQAPRRNIEIDQGDDETITLAREAEDGTAKDISGYTFWLTVKGSPDDADADAALQKTVTSHTDAANGKTQFDLAAGDTDSLTGSYYYDIQEKTSGGSVNTLLRGRFIVTVDITESTS